MKGFSVIRHQGRPTANLFGKALRLSISYTFFAFLSQFIAQRRSGKFLAELVALFIGLFVFEGPRRFHGAVTHHVGQSYQLDDHVTKRPNNIQEGSIRGRKILGPCLFTILSEVYLLIFALIFVKKGNSEHGPYLSSSPWWG